MYFEVGDKIKMKKAHPCGSHEWDVLRVGMDFLRAFGDGIQDFGGEELPRRAAQGGERIS